LTELEYINEIIISADPSETNESIPARKTIVYQTLIDPATIRIEAEKNKHKLFRKHLFQLTNPGEIEYVSTEKFYEPFTTVAGKYFIDYYRKCVHEVKLDKEVKEIILFDHTFLPDQFPYLTNSKHSILLRGEERIIKEMKAFVLLNKNGKESKISDFPPAPSIENPQEIVESFKLQELDPNLEVDLIRKRIVQRPADINRVVSETFEINERSLIYTPRFWVTYKSPRLGKQASFIFDGVTSKIISGNESMFSTARGAISKKLKSLYRILTS
jgi:hypothetical protein